MKKSEESKKPDFFSIFVFPFKYSRNNGKECKPSEIAKALAGDNKDAGKGWTPETFKADTPENYNEWNYFHPFVRTMLFSGGGNGMCYLVRKDFNEIEIQYDDKKTSGPVSMKVQSIDLHLYENQIGLLAITTENEAREPYSFSQLLRYNDLARRVSPQFLGEPDGTRDFASDTRADCLIPKRAMLSGPGKDPVPELFKIAEISEGKTVPYLSEIIKTLLLPLSLKALEDSEKSSSDFLFQPYTDDRMFVISYYADAGLAKKLSGFPNKNYGYEDSDDWFKFLFVDGGFASVANAALRRELLRKHTYARWAGYGTLFGMSRYSFVALCAGSKDTDRVVYVPMKGCYYQLALIILFQRAMLLEFAERVRTLIDDFRKANEYAIPGLLRRAETLQRDFISFTTKYSFAEVTPQEQGIEIYNKWAEIIELDILFNDVKQEIDQLSDFVRTKISHETDRSIRDLTVILLVLTLGLVLFGDSLFKGDFCRWWNEACLSHPGLAWLAGVTFIILAAVFVAQRFFWRPVYNAFASFRWHEDKSS